MLARKVPPCAILGYAQSMAGREMPSKHLAVPAAFQANDVITMKRSPDRDGGCPLTFGDGCRFSESHERLMHCRDQCPYLVGADLVLSNISCNNSRSESSTK